ncbi:MAG: type II secretion system protein E [Zetaproteobacteria bacterium]|nr:MAG: type II secretion system protein E [Zetaproteobacteria bacterium]
MFQQFKRQKHDVTEENTDVEGEIEDQQKEIQLEVVEAKRVEENHKDHLRTELKVRLHQELLDIVNLDVLDKMDRKTISEKIGPMVRELLAKERKALNKQEYDLLLEELLDEVLGLGPLEPLLKDPTISDILVNTHSQVFIERFGKLERVETQFKDDAHLTRIIQKIVNAVGRRVDESQPWVDARLLDGSRVNALLPPCAVDGPLLSIRKFSKMPFTMDRLIENGTITEDISKILYAIIRTRLNVLISGGTGTGKTTMLNALSSLISNRERIVTIEDTAELQLQQEHLGRMETRHANIEGVGEVTQGDLLRNSLRMRPDRIIVGEVRGAEVLDMLQAMNTGHDGSMTTVHANSPRDALTRLEHMIGMTGLEIPTKALRSQIASAIHIVIQIQRMADGTRKLVSLQEIVGMEGDVVSMQEIVKYVRTGISPDGDVLGHHVTTGIRPKFAQKAQECGYPIPDNLLSGK